MGSALPGPATDAARVVEILKAGPQPFARLREMLGYGVAGRGLRHLIIHEYVDRGDDGDYRLIRHYTSSRRWSGR